MKLFKSSILAMLGLAVALTACSDDKEYTPAGPSAGAYFPVKAPATLYVSDEMTSVDVEVYRTQDAGTSFQVTAEDPSGLFTIPTTVAFDGTSLVSNLTISFDPAKLVTDQPYKVTLTLAGTSQYGATTYAFNIVKADPMVTEAIGTGNYTYNCIWSGDDEDLPVVKSYMPANPDKLTVSYGGGQWGYGITLDIDVPNVKDLDVDGDTKVYVHPQFTGYVHSTYGEVWVADIYSYVKDYYEPTFGESLNVPDASYYTVEKGKFSLNMIYFIPKYNDGGSYLGSQTYEYLQLSGYPEYDIEVSYDGLFIKKDGSMTANATITAATDVETVKAVMVAGKDPQEGLTAINADADGVQEFAANGVINAAFPVSEGGVYTIVAASYGEGSLQAANYDTFTITLSDDNADWENLGLGAVMDGWIMAAFQMNGVVIDVTQYPFQVPIQQHKEDKELFRLVQPYGPDYPLNANNAFPATRNIQFHIAESMIFMQPQPSGFGTANMGGELVIGNWAGYVEQQNPDVSYAQLKTFIASKGWEIDEYNAEEGYAIIVEPMHEGAQGFGYVWGQNPQPAYIFMPNASSSTKAKVKAAAVATPKYNGMMRAIRAEKAANHKREVFARSASTIKPLDLKK